MWEWARWSLWALLPRTSTRNPCPIPSEISSDVEGLVNVPTCLAVPDFRAQNIPSWPPHWPWRKAMFAQWCRPLWHHVRCACGLRGSRDLVSHLIWPCQPTTQPLPRDSHSHSKLPINCQGRWEKTMEQRWEMGNQCQLQGKPWGEAAAPPTVPLKFTLWHCYLLSSPYVPADIWKEPCSSSSFHCPVLLSPIPCFPLHMYSHSFLL